MPVINGEPVFTDEVDVLRDLLAPGLRSSKFDELLTTGSSPAEAETEAAQYVENLIGMVEAARA